MNYRLVLLFLLGLSFANIGFSGNYNTCQNPLPSGTNTLSGNVSAAGHCFWFNSNTELDCKGYSINGPGNSFALLANINKNNVTIKNCIITSFQLGSYIDRSTNFIFDNITSYGSEYGLWLRDSSNITINNSETSFNNFGLFAGANSYTSSNIGVYNHIANSNGFGVSSRTGVIYFKVDSGIVDNVSINANPTGLYLDYSNNIEVNNLKLSGNLIGTVVSASNDVDLFNVDVSNSVLSSGIVLQLGTNNTNISNVNSFNNNYGIAVSDSSNNTFNNLNISNNLNIGFYTVGASNYNKIYNSNIYDNKNYDFGMDSLSIINQCDNILSNITGTNNLPIKYFNSSVSLSDEILAELFLCDADNSNINNISINSGSNFQNNAIMSFFVDNSNFTDIKINNTRWGLYFRNSSHNIIDNYNSFNNYVGSLSIYTTFSNFSNINVYNSSTNALLINFGENNRVINFSSTLAVAGTSFEVRDSDNNYFENIMVNDTKLYSGFYLMRSSSNIVKNLNSSFSFFNGVVINNNSNNNVFLGNNNLFNNTIFGLSFADSVGGNYSGFNIFNNGASGIYLQNTDDMNIFDSNSSTNFAESLVLKNSDNNNFSNFISSGSQNFSGLYFYNSSFNNILNVTSSNNFLNGVTVTNSSNSNIFLDSTFDFNKKNGFSTSYDSKNSELINSNFKNNLVSGIGVGIDSNVSVLNSESYSNLLGIVMENSAYNLISDSRILGNVGGVYFLGDSDSSEVFNSSVYSNFLGDVYFDAKNLSVPDNNVLFGNTFDSVVKVFTDVDFSVNKNYFNSSRLGFGNVGNFWTEFSCSSTDIRGDYFVCLNPVNLLIDLTFNIFDYAPLSNHPGLIENVTARELNYVTPTLPDGTKFSRSNFTIKFGDGVTDISPCLAKVNNLVGGVTFSDGYCTLKISNITGGQQDFTFQAYSSQFTFEKRTITYYPNPDSMFELSGFNVLSILSFIVVVGLFLW